MLAISIFSSSICFSQGKYYWTDPTQFSNFAQTLQDTFNLNPNADNQDLVTAQDGVHIKLACGEWVVNSQVDIPNYCTLTLEAGASIVKNNCTGNTDPIFNLNGWYSSIKGENYNEVKVTCNGQASGLIYVGHSETGPTYNRGLFNQLSNLHLVGFNNGSSQGTISNNSTGIYFNSQEFEIDSQTLDTIKRTVYFNNIENCIFSYLDHGIILEGFSNGNNISNIVFNRVGNVPGGAAITFLNGSGQNRISNIQHHFAINSTTFHFEQLAGAPYWSYANIINSGLIEGTNVVAIRMDSPAETTQNIFVLHSNGKGDGTVPIIPTTDNIEDYFNTSTNNNILVTAYDSHESRFGSFLKIDN